MLMLLHANRQDNERTYAKNIRQWLKANGARPHGTRRAAEATFCLQWRF